MIRSANVPVMTLANMRCTWVTMEIQLSFQTEWMGHFSFYVYPTWLSFVIHVVVWALPPVCWKRKTRTDLSYHSNPKIQPRSQILSYSVPGDGEGEDLETRLPLVLFFLIVMPSPQKSEPWNRKSRESVVAPTIGWFSNITGTLADDGARKSNGWTANWAPEVEFTCSPFRALFRRQMTSLCCC